MSACTRIRMSTRVCPCMCIHIFTLDCDVRACTRAARANARTHMALVPKQCSHAHVHKHTHTPVFARVDHIYVCTIHG